MKHPELTSHMSDLWTRLDKVRSDHPLEEVIAPFAATLFLLRWADHLDTEQEAVAAFDGHDYLPVLSRDQHWSSWCDLRGAELVDVLRGEVLPALRNAPNTNLGLFLQRLAPVVEVLVHESPEMIEALVQWAQAFNLETVTGRQVAGDALGALVEKTTAKAKTLREHTTPRPVVELMTDLLDPSPGERIYDPCFGTGGLLSTVASKLREKAMQMPPKVWTEVQQHSVFGVEISPYGYSIGLARVVLAGIEQPRLELGDALERPLAKNRSSEGFDCILAVPPWGARARPEVAAQFQESKAKSETLFLQHVMASLRRGGRAVIALPDSTLFRPGPDRKVRKELLTDYCVEGVVSLPAGAFHPYTGIKTSLVLFHREKAAQAVRFMQVEEWPSIRPEDGFSREKAGEAVRSIADEFRSGTPNGSLWETPVKELKTRDWELVAKRTGEEALSRFLQALQEADVEVSIQPLNKVAEIFTGVSYRKSVTTPHGDDPSVFAGLVRVADVNRTGIQPPSIFLTNGSSERVHPKHRLRAGDILLTISGTIGKLAIVSEPTGTVDSVAAKSLVVIRPKEQISSQFLKSLLASDAYQEWIRGHVRGATIQHLSIRTLRHLPVLVPQVPIQEHIVKQMDEEGDDPFAALVRILTGDSEELVVSWLMGSPDVQELRRSDQTASRVALLERVAHSVWELQNQVAQSRTSPQFASWLKDLAEAVKMLQGLNHVPPGSGRMALLDSAQHRLKEVYSTIRRRGDSYLAGWKSGVGFHSGLPVKETLLPAFASAIDVTRRISQLVRAELDSLLEDIELDPSIEPSAVVAGTENEIQIRVKNLSPLALRNVSVSTSPPVGSTHIGYLAEDEMLSFTAKIPARTETRPFQFELRWQADRLDGQPVSGELPLAVEIRSTREAVHLAELGTSPYIVGSPIDREEMFFGRQDIIDTIQRQLSTSHQANVIFLEGNRRTGKTSILKRLQAPNVLPGWIVVYCSLQGGEGHESKAGLPTNEVFRLMARDIGWATHDAGLRVWLPDMNSPDPDKPFKVTFAKALSTAFSGARPFEIFELYIQSVLEAASPRRLLLMLDEFDKLQEGIDAKITSSQVPENIRYLLHTYSDMSAILTGSYRLTRLRKEYWSTLFGFGHPVSVRELPLEDARLLVTQPVMERFTYVPEARNRVVELCSQQPFLIQSLCNRIFDHAARSGERTVTVGTVNTTAQEMVKDNEHFRTLWGYAETERRRFILALCQQLEGEPDPITLSLLETKLEEYGIALPQEDRLGDDLEFLRELELLELQETARGSAYMLAVPLMAAWIRRNIDFEDQRQQAVRESEEISGGYDGRGQGDGSGYGYGLGDGRGRGDGSGYGASHRNNYNSTTLGDEQ